MLEKLVEEQVLEPEEVQITDATQVVAEQHPLGLKPAKLLADSKLQQCAEHRGAGRDGDDSCGPAQEAAPPLRDFRGR